MSSPSRLWLYAYSTFVLFIIIWGLVVILVRFTAKAKKKVRFLDKTEEFNTESVTKEEESSYQNEDLQKGAESGEEGSEKSQDRIDRVGKHLLQDLADYFSSNVVVSHRLTNNQSETVRQNPEITLIKSFAVQNVYYCWNFEILGHCTCWRIHNLEICLFGNPAPRKLP